MATGNGGHDLFEFCSHASIPLSPWFSRGGNDAGYAQSEAAARVYVEAAAAASCLRAEQAEVVVTREMDEEKSLLRRAREVGYDDDSEGDDDDEEEHALPVLRKRSRAQVRPGFYEKLQKKILAEEAAEAGRSNSGSQESSSDEEFDEMECAVDTSWPTRGSGHAYKSNCGCTQFVGIQNRQIVGYHTMTKECDTCLRKRNAARAAAKSTGTNEAAAVAAATPAGFKARHDCRENHHGAGKSSKSMEPEGTAAIALAAFSRGAVIRKLCQDDDATTAAVMKRENQQTEVTKTRKVTGRMPLKYPDVTIMKDPSHVTRNVGAAAYKAFPNQAKKTSGIAAMVKKNYGYALRDALSKGLTPQQTRTGLHVGLLRHPFDDHGGCSREWCPKLKNHLYKPADLPFQRYLDEEHRPAIQAIFEKYAALDVLGSMEKGTDTQTNEASHRGQIKCGPKHKPMKNGSYDGRIALSVVTMRAKWRRASVPSAPVAQAAPAAVAATSSAAATPTAATPTTATAAVSLSETTARGRPKRNVHSTHMRQHGNGRGVPLAPLGSPWTRNKRNGP